MGWQIAKERHFAQVLEFLRTREWGCVSFTAQLHRDGVPEFPSRLRKRIHIDSNDDETVHGAVLQTTSGLVYPVFRTEREEMPELPEHLYKRIRRGSLIFNTVMGRGGHVRALENLVPKDASHSVDYYLMVQKSPVAQPTAKHLADLNVELHLGTPDKTDKLFALQEGYEREEVLLEGRSFQPQAAWQSLKQALRKQVVVYATEDGHPIGKAATNARGFDFDQIGGVFTEPAHRNRGIAQALMRYILGFVQDAGKRATLFVKTHNRAAIALYRNLGFEILDDFRISYYL